MCSEKGISWRFASKGLESSLRPEALGRSSRWWEGREGRESEAERAARRVLLISWDVLVTEVKRWRCGDKVLGRMAGSSRGIWGAGERGSQNML